MPAGNSFTKRSARENLPFIDDVNIIDRTLWMDTTKKGGKDKNGEVNGRVQSPFSAQLN